jgi:hypothetical protein
MTTHPIANNARDKALRENIGFFTDEWRVISLVSRLIPVADH